MTPGDRIRNEMEARGWTQRDLAKILGRPLPAVNEIIQGKRSITPEMAIALSGAFGIDAVSWLQMEAVFRLAQIRDDSNDVATRAKLYEIAPVKDMEKRGWIKTTETAEELRQELTGFFGADPVTSPPDIPVSFKRTGENDLVNNAQRAWCFRAKQLAAKVVVEDYDDQLLERGIKRLRRLIGWPEEARKVPRILAEMGIRFVIIEPLPHTKIDGAAFWLNATSPVIAMSVRFDRIDSFWHVLGHEISHIKHRDDPVIDTDIADESQPDHKVLSQIEKRANDESAAMWIDPQEMDSFVLRVAPLYSKAKINQFANRLVIHPGLIVGQLQGRKEIGYQALRDTLVKVRSYVTNESITDGWGSVFGL